MLRFHPLLRAAFIVILTLTACSQQIEPTATPVPTATNAPPTVTSTPLPQRVPLLRVAVLGNVSVTNVWALFDETGADYWDYAPQISYWPRLYQLSHQTLDFAPAFAKDIPSPLSLDGETYTSIVPLKPDQHWTDGSELTANDVVFTVNTALQFELGGLWRAYFNETVLDHAEAVDRYTVKYYFKTKPSVADWQYSTLQGPIVSKTFWQQTIDSAIPLLPDDALRHSIDVQEKRSTDLQAQVDELYQNLASMNAADRAYEDVKREADRVQRELTGANSTLKKLHREYDDALSTAQALLYNQSNTGEPTIGAWIFQRSDVGMFENKINHDISGTLPWFDAVRYSVYPNEKAAVQALLRGDVDLLLTPDGLSSNSVEALQGNNEVTLSVNPTSKARFLVLNTNNPFLADKAIRQAIACLIDPDVLAAELDGEVVSLSSFVLPANQFWFNTDVKLPCSGTEAQTRSENVRPLFQGKAPVLTLLAPSANIDPLRAQVATNIAATLEQNGIKVNLQLTDVDTILYAVYGSGQFDMAILGWRLGLYPVYLCDWYEPSDVDSTVNNGGRLALSANAELKSACEALRSDADLDAARAQVFEIQSILAKDLPLIPLYTEKRYDAFRNLAYPFGEILDGLGRLYGGPAFAIPK